MQTTADGLLARSYCISSSKTYGPRLFPSHSEPVLPTVLARDDNIPRTADEEIEQIMKRFANCKNEAPGPNGIPEEEVNILLQETPEVFRHMDWIGQDGRYPPDWKILNLVLIL